MAVTLHYERSAFELGAVQNSSSYWVDQVVAQGHKPRSGITNWVAYTSGIHAEIEAVNSHEKSRDFGVNSSPVTKSSAVSTSREQTREFEGAAKVHQRDDIKANQATTRFAVAKKAGGAITNDATAAKFIDVIKAERAHKVKPKQSLFQQMIKESHTAQSAERVRLN